MKNIQKVSWLFAICMSAAAPEGWTEPVVVTHDEKPVMRYQARWDGSQLVVRAAIEPGWHTFVMDNKQREQEKLAGKPSLGIEKSTEISLAGGLAVSGPWRQSSPKDFSKPELRYFSWGFEREAIFAANARRAGSGPAQVEIRGQACMAEICKNIDVALTVPLSASKPGAAPANLIQVR